MLLPLCLSIACIDTLFNDDLSEESEVIIFNAKERLYNFPSNCNGQTQAHIDDAEVRYQAYLRAGNNGVSEEQTDKLFEQYKIQADLADLMISKIGC